LKTQGTAAAGNAAATTLQIPNAADTYASNNTHTTLATQLALQIATGSVFMAPMQMRLMQANLPFVFVLSMETTMVVSLLTRHLRLSLCHLLLTPVQQLLLHSQVHSLLARQSDTPLPTTSLQQLQMQMVDVFS
jgi:hypothetical protein